MRTIVIAGTLFGGAGDVPTSNQAIVIATGRIQAIIPAAQLQAEPDDQVLDCSEHFVLPGLIDSHVHLAFAGGPDHATVRAILESDSRDTSVLRQLHNAQECLLAGVTTVRDCGGRDLTSFALRDAIAAGLAAGPRILACGQPITTTGGHLHFCRRRADSVTEVLHAARSLIEAGADFIKVMATGGNMTPGSNPAQPQYRQEELDALVEDSHRLGRRIAAHVGAAEGIRRCLLAGVDSLEHGNWLQPDGTVGYDPAIAELWAGQGAYLGLAVAGYDRINLLRDRFADAAAHHDALVALFRKYAPFRALRAAGVPIMVSSDGGVRLTPFRHHWLSLQAYSFAMEVSAAETLRAATSVAAAGLGLDAEIGVIAPGKRADVLVVAGNPLRDLGDLRRVHLVLRDGQVVVEQGRLVAPAAGALT